MPSSLTPLTLTSPAKLNLFLHITGQRDDGYHLLQTVFQLLDFGDEMTFRPRTAPEIELSPELDGVKNEDNLIVKAAKALKNATNYSKGADIHIKKYLPMGGGIGGGSSNAATTLVALNHLWQTRLSCTELMVIGAKLGADVPVFIRARSAWAEGVGEILTPLTLPEKWFLVLTPNCHVSTNEIFLNKHLTRDSSPIKVATFLERGGHNDCQNIVTTLYPQVKEAIDWLSQFSSAQMTGTGACVFASFPDKEAAEKVLGLANKPCNGFIAKGINQSSLHRYLS